MIAQVLLAVLATVRTGTLEDLLGPTDTKVAPWLRVLGSGGRDGRVLRLNGHEWVEVPNAHHAIALADGRRALVDRKPGYAIIDEQGQEKARLPGVSWLSGDKRRLYYATAAPTGENIEQRTVTLRIWSHEGAPIEQRTASLPPAERPGFICAGEVTMIGMLSSGEPAIEQICLPRSRDASAPQLQRLFALRGDKLFLIARAVDRAPTLGNWGSRALWRVRLPKALTFLEGGDNPLF